MESGELGQFTGSIGPLVGQKNFHGKYTGGEKMTPERPTFYPQNHELGASTTRFDPLQNFMTNNLDSVKRK